MKKIAYIIFFGGMIAAPIVLVSLPSDYFDTGHATCLSVILLNKSCLGCGITRAIQHLIHFEFKIAAEYNKIVFIVFPILCYLWATEMRRIYRRIKLL